VKRNKKKEKIQRLYFPFLYSFSCSVFLQTVIEKQSYQFNIGKFSISINNSNPAAAGSSLNNTHGMLNIKGIEINHLNLCDLLDLVF